MRFMHLADLHIGKKVHEFSMLEDQKYILEEILRIVDEQKPDAVLIAGDNYDKSIPPTEAVGLFDDFLVKLANREVKTLVISGNHDSAQRLAFGSRLMKSKGLHISPVYDGKIEKIALQDEYGDVNIYMLPFVKPANVRQYFPDEAIENYTEAIKCVLDDLHIDGSSRNVLMAHQFVTGSQRSDSEEINVGGLDNVDFQVFEGFDYVALGHIHKPQSVGKKTIRYSGTPLKYSFSEVDHQKSVTMLDMGKKGEISINTVDLIPLRDMVKIRGNYMEITAKSFYENRNLEDYYHITLTDEEDVPEALNKLRVIYKNLMRLEYDNTRTRSDAQIELTTDIETKSPLELIDEFYYMQNNQSISKMQREYLEKLIDEIWEGAI